MNSTHPLIRKLILITAWFSIGSLLLQSLFDLPVYQLFLLNSNFITCFYLWQPVTALFYIPTDTLSFGFIVDVAFSLLILSTLGSHIVDFLGKKRFFLLYIGAALVAFCTALIAIACTEKPVFISLVTPSLLAITTIWTMCVRSQHIYFLFFPIPTRAFLAIALLMTVIASAVQKNYVEFCAYTSTFLFSYFVGIIAWNLSSPFQCLQKLEDALKHMSHSLKIFWQWKIMNFFRAKKSQTREKEEQFIDETLEKISRNGTKSLSILERVRLYWISLKKR